MSETGTELRQIAWSQAFPFVRLFRTLSLALDFQRMLLGLAAVVAVYLGGRALDYVWGDRGAAATLPGATIPSNEVEAYTLMEGREFQAFVKATQTAEKAVTEAGANAKPIAKRGPFAALLHHEMRCFSGAVQGVCSGRLGFSAGPYTGEPTMSACIVAAWQGVGWLVLHRQFYALFFAIWCLLVFAYFGGAICRSAAVQAAREESIAPGAATAFVREKYVGFLLAPALPVVAILAIGALIALLAGLVGCIPVIGTIVTPLFFILTLVGGFAMALFLIALVLSFPLMWPTIAVEGSDGWDGLSRAFSYVGARLWHLLFYGVVLLVHGALAFAFVRLMAMLTLKLSHTATKLTMNLVHHPEVETLGKLDALWSMPAWANLSLIPRADAEPFWGTFAVAELGPLWWFGAACLRIWVYLIVGLVGAFIVSYFFSGSVQLYYLLRRDVDGTDFEEVYYEEPEEELLGLPPTEATPAGPGGGAETNV